MHHMSHTTSPEVLQSIIMPARVPPLRYCANDKIWAYFSERYKQIITAIMRPLRSRIKAASRLVSVPRNPSGVRSRENREKTSLAFGCRSSAISRTNVFLSLYRFLLFLHFLLAGLKPPATCRKVIDLSHLQEKNLEILFLEDFIGLLNR